jgi:chromosome segregation ATPase
MSRTEKNLIQIINEAQSNILDSNESLSEEKSEDSGCNIKDSLAAKCRETIEVIYIQNLYEEIESQKRQRREVELACKESENRVQSLEKRLKDANSKLLEYKEENEKLNDTIFNLKKLSKAHDKNIAYSKLNEDLEQEILSLKHQLSEKTLTIQDLNGTIKGCTNKIERLETENNKLKEENEDYQQKNDDLIFKCERLGAQAKISETITLNLKQAQEDYQKYLKEEKETNENKEKELKEKYQQLEAKLKKRFQTKEYQLKQEVTQSIQDIQKSIEINDSEHDKTRNENILLKENIKNLNENFNNLEHSLRDQIDKLEQDLYTSKIALKEKTGQLERLESAQKHEKSKLDNALQREKDFESYIKSHEDKAKTLELKAIEFKKTVDGLNSEIFNLKTELEKEKKKVETKEYEILRLVEREKDFLSKISKTKEEKLEEIRKISKEFEEKLQVSKNMINQEAIGEYEEKIEEYENKIQKLLSENKALKLKNDQKQKISARDEPRPDDSIYEEINALKNKLSKLQKTKSSADQKILSLKEDYSSLEDKIKQDSIFFKNETIRKDEELIRLKKKFENKLREIYAEHSIVVEQLRNDLLRLNNDIRGKDPKESLNWIGKSLDEMIKRIPSY